MPRLLGTDLPDEKTLAIALTRIFGVGRPRAQVVAKQSGVDVTKRARDLSPSELSRIQKVLEQFELEGDLRRTIRDNIDRLKRIRAYRGLRHIQKLPVRGQRTRTNARNARGGIKRRTIGSLSKEEATKVEDTKKT